MKFILFFLAFLSFEIFSQGEVKNCDTISRTILFETGKHALTSKFEEKLLEYVDEINGNGITEIYLVGHTDIHGSLEYNKGLSRRRVNEVQEAIENEIDISISSLYYGEDSLKISKSNKVNDSLNRRVEIRYYLPCESDIENNTTSSKTSRIYRKDRNCHFDSAISENLYDKVLTHNQTTKVVVMDWTRSMYPYGLHMLDWFERNSQSAGFKEVLLFNDGDRKKTSEKRMGNTGGFYSGSMSNIDSLVGTMEKVAKKGTGGDFPENYIEALLHAEKEFPYADTIILIADNRACVRDYKLISLLTKPVKIILNEINQNSKIINYQFLSIAAQTGGSVYFMDEEIIEIEFKDSSAKPHYYKDTMITLPKVKGSLKTARKKIAQMKREQQKYSVPPMISIEGSNFPYCRNTTLTKSKYKIGCADCYRYDFVIKSHVTFKEKYTFRQRCALLIESMKGECSGMGKSARKRCRKRRRKNRKRKSRSSGKKREKTQ